MDLDFHFSYSHLMACEYELRISSARIIVNFVRMILQTDHTSTGNHSENSNLLQVPYPEHVVNALSRAGHSLVWLYRNKSVSASMVEISMPMFPTSMHTSMLTEIFQSVLDYFYGSQDPAARILFCSRRIHEPTSSLRR